jgi:hypothetical protein
MANTAKIEKRIEDLKKKFQAVKEQSEGDPSSKEKVRRVRKRLKRAQRKLRKIRAAEAKRAASGKAKEQAAS